jgi:branched-chain amino acid aminotransferase
LTTLKGIQQGKIEDTFGWLYKVDKPAEWNKFTANGTHGEETVDELP